MARSPALAAILRTPPTGLRTLTLANVITDATRRANLGGDGLAEPGGFGVWPAATNLCINGGGETNATGWAASSNYVISRSTEQAKFGAASLKSVFPASSTGTGTAVFAITLTAAAHAGSMWVYVPTDYDGGALAAEFLNFGSPTVASTRAAVDLGLRDQWQRLSVTITPAAGDLVGDIRLTIDGALPTTGRAIYVDGVQVETGSIATPYIETDGATATRAAAGIEINPTGLLTPTQGWIAYRLKMGWGVASEASPGGNPPFLLQWSTDGSNNIAVDYDATNNWWRLTRIGAATSAQTQTAALTFATGDEVTIIAAWDATGLHISFNGAAFVSTAQTAIPALPATLYLASWASTRQVSSNVRWIMLGKGIPAAGDVTAINAYTAPPPTLGQIAMLSFASKPTLLIPAKTGDAVLLPAYFVGG